MRIRALTVAAVAASWLVAGVVMSAPPAKPAAAKKAKPEPAPKAPWVTPSLPGGKEVVTDTSDKFLKAPDNLLPEVKIAKAVPTVDFAFFPGQTYEAEIWSSWGESVVANGKYYSTIGDHMHPAGKHKAYGPGHSGAGAAYIFEYDPTTKSFKELMDTNKLLNLPEGTYMPGKFHARLEMGSDGWLYGSTHRGSQRSTNDQYHFKGDWILRCNPETGSGEVVVHAPVPGHCLPNGMLDPERLIYYCGTAAGTGKDIKFMAYDLKNKKMLYTGDNGPGRCMILASSTGKVYFTPALGFSPLMSYDPASGQPPKEIPGEIGIRAATRETPQGIVYTISQGGNPAKGSEDSTLYAFNTKTEKIEELGPIAISKPIVDAKGKPHKLDYVASLVADPSGRYLYYTIGAHGGSEKIGSAVVQYDTKTKTKKVVAFLSPFYTEKYDVTPRGSFNIAIDEKGETVYITWNSKRGPGDRPAWDTVTMTAVHIPESERPL